MNDQNPPQPKDTTLADTDITPSEHEQLIEDEVIDQQPSPKKPIAKIIIILIVILLLLGFIAFGLWKSYQPKTVSIQGRVDAEVLQVSTKVPSRIESILVHEGQSVNIGDVLVQLSSPEVEAKKQQAEASLQSALALQSTATRGSQQENIDSLYANWQSVQAQATLADQTYQRGANLFKEGVISRQRRDEMYAAKVSAAQLAEASRQQYIRAQRGSTNEQQNTADAQVAIAKAAVQEANALASETVLNAPVKGTISKIYGQPSELVAIGVPVVSILKDDFWVNLDVREDQYANVYKQDSLEGFIPALNKSATFNIAHIEAEGEFATIKNTRQTGGYDIRSFKIKLIPAMTIPDLKVGMSVIFDVQESP